MFDATPVQGFRVTYWDDLRVPMTSTKLGGTRDPGFEVFKKNAAGTSQGVFLYWFDSGTEEEIYFAAQMPHGWDRSPISPHVHWVPKTTADGSPATQTVIWGLEYAWAEIGAVFTTTTIITAAAHEPSDANIVAGKHYLTPFADISATASTDGLSSMLVCRLFRDAANDTYENDAGLLEIDFHFAMGQLGSKQEYVY
jgi:hypothetical protein